jgi:hypothetical protein
VHHCGGGADRADQADKFKHRRGSVMQMFDSIAAHADAVIKRSFVTRQRDECCGFSPCLHHLESSEFCPATAHDGKKMSDLRTLNVQARSPIDGAGHLQ